MISEKINISSKNSKKKIVSVFSWFALKGRKRIRLTRMLREIKGYTTNKFIGLYIPTDLGPIEIRNWTTILRAYSELIYSVSPEYYFKKEFKCFRTYRKKIFVYNVNDIYNTILFREGPVNINESFFKGSKLVARIETYPDFGVNLRLYGTTLAKITRILKKYGLKPKWGPVPEVVKNWLNVDETLKR